MLANPRQELDEIQLIEQVVLEPQDQLVVRRVIPDDGSPLSEIVHRIDDSGLTGSGKVARTDLDQFRIGQPARNWPFVEWIGPDGEAAWNLGGFDQLRRARTVRDVEEVRMVRHGAS